QQLSMLPFWLCSWPRPDKLSIGIEITMRNLNLALLLKALLFPATVKGADPVADGVLFVILFYAAVAMFSGLPLALIFRIKARRAAQRQQLSEKPREVKADLGQIQKESPGLPARMPLDEGIVPPK